MPRIFDNIEQHMVHALQDTLKISERADFCVGYFNLRGWRYIDELMDNWRGGEDSCCRLLIGMHDKPENELRKVFSLRGEQEIDSATVYRLKTRIAQDFREQLLIGAPTNADQQGLRRLSRQLREQKVIVKLFLRHKLHAKLYLLHLKHPITPIVGYMGSSNLTLAGLMHQGELNVDVVDSDACQKLARWFNDRWDDRWCLDISQELADIIDESWAREEVLPPYYIYLKMAYHLSEEARAGLLEFRIPRDFKEQLFDYQVAAVKISAHHLNKRGGVLIGDVVGLGKTLMATALARIMQDDYGTETLVICPKNLVKMWREYLHDYHLVGEVHAVSNVINELPNLRRFRLVIIDESHNLRNREGKRYKVIKDYIEKNESKCVLLSATPYNKTYLDLSAQLRLFLSDEQSKDLGIRPEKLLNELGESKFHIIHQCPIRSLTAFEKSEYADDWRELMRLYLVRRTRSFIQENYAHTDPATGQKYLTFANGIRSYFPVRTPRTVKFGIDGARSNDPIGINRSESEREREQSEQGHGGRPQGPQPRIHATPAPTREPERGERWMPDGAGSNDPIGINRSEREQGSDGRPQGPHTQSPGLRPRIHTAPAPTREAEGGVRWMPDGAGSNDPYAFLYSDRVVETVNELNLPRYGMANYIVSHAKPKPTPAEAAQLASLSKAGKRLMGFCRTNLFKRLESGGPAFIQSLERHVLRNYIFLYAIEAGVDLPLGTQNAELLDARTTDEDAEALLPDTNGEDDAARVPQLATSPLRTEADYRQRAAEVYQEYATQYRRRFKWLRPSLFTASLKKDLLQDARNLLHILTSCGPWQVERDAKFTALVDLLTQQHPQEKVLIFTQFADTVYYLTTHLKARGITAVEGVTGDSADPTELAWRFSPISNGKRDQIHPDQELRVLLATDVLSEGQNLQDAAIVVNYDLPWAIIRLIQRAGRVDRIGQRSTTISCYSFLPAEGVERLIRLRERVRLRLRENAEVVGTDEAFFEDDENNTALIDLYNEKAGILDGEADNEVDLASQAYQIWKNATDANPRLKSIIEKLPNVAFSTRAHTATAAAPEGVLLYMRTAEGNDTLAWVNRKGESVTQSQLAILRAAACDIQTQPIARPPEQHDLVKTGVEHIVAEETKGVGGQLGRPSGARLRTYERLKHYADSFKDTLFPPSPDLLNAIDEIYRYPLQESARDTLNRQMRSGITHEQLAQLVVDLRADNRLCLIQEETEPQEPHIICSLGLFEATITS